MVRVWMCGGEMGKKGVEGRRKGKRGKRKESNDEIPLIALRVAGEMLCV